MVKEEDFKMSNKLFDPAYWEAEYSARTSCKTSRALAESSAHDNLATLEAKLSVGLHLFVCSAIKYTYTHCVDFSKSDTRKPVKVGSLIDFPGSFLAYVLKHMLCVCVCVCVCECVCVCVHN